MSSPRFDKFFRPAPGNISAFLLGGIAGASLMSIAALLFLRANLVVRYDFDGVSMHDLDAAVESSLPRATGWTATREVCNLPMASSGRLVRNWKFCNRRYAQALIDGDSGMTVSAFLPCTVSITHDESDGHAVVSRLNTRLIGALLGGDARVVFSKCVAPEQDALIRSLADHSLRGEAIDSSDTADVPRTGTPEPLEVLP